MNNKATLIKNEETLFDFLTDEFKNTFSPDSSVLIKTHMGEPGNKHFIDSGFTSRIIRILKNTGFSPFVFDTPVVYTSPRNNAEDYLDSAAAHGYREDKIGAPVKVSNESITVKGESMDYELASAPLEADGVLLLSHFKGHMCCGIGGSIKNVGMGCMSKKTKGDIHTGGEPVYVSGCTQCGICVENCPTDNVRLSGDRPYFDANWCPGCSNCILSCPEKCISAKQGTFDHLLAEGAVLAHEHFKKVFALNVLKGITRLCDCIADSGPVLVEDIGFVCAADMLSADIASLETVRDITGREDIFREHNKVSSWGHVREVADIMGRSMQVVIDRL